MWVLIVVFLDSIDGLVARAFWVSSEIGKQLDSLCDVISFGVVPGYFMHKYLSDFLPYELVPLSLLTFVVTLASIYRLARFNITPSSQLDFQGMPTPSLVCVFILNPRGLGQWESRGRYAPSTKCHALQCVPLLFRRLPTRAWPLDV